MPKRQLNEEQRRLVRLLAGLAREIDDLEKQLAGLEAERRRQIAEAKRQKVPVRQIAAAARIGKTTVWETES